MLQTSAAVKRQNIFAKNPQISIDKQKKLCYYKKNQTETDDAEIKTVNASTESLGR